ncbi:MAG: hypothetical protein Q9193_004723, partial [Seirophora villosa]
QKQKKLEQEGKAEHAPVTTEQNPTSREQSAIPAFHHSNTTSPTLSAPRQPLDQQVEMADQSVVTEMPGTDPLLSHDPLSSFDDMCFTTALEGTPALPAAHDLLHDCPTFPPTVSNPRLRDGPRNSTPSTLQYCCHCKSKRRPSNGSLLSQRSSSSIPLTTNHSLEPEGPPSPVSMTDISHQLKASRPAALGPCRTAPTTSRSLLEHQPERRLQAHSPQNSAMARSLGSGAIARRPVLHPPTENGHASIVAKLVQRGADVNATDAKGRSALHLAAERSQLAVLKVLLAAGADVNADAGDGWTPLHQAGYSGFEEGVDILLEYGAQY